LRHLPRLGRLRTGPDGRAPGPRALGFAERGANHAGVEASVSDWQNRSCADV
jgi:hypothetical protein